MKKLKFPIGEFIKPDLITTERVNEWIREIELFPKRLKSLTQNLDKKELDFNYRPQGWTIWQVVHHCADSHMNSVIRFKLALTEESPTIKPYFEAKWAELSDVTISIDASVKLLEGLHYRWAVLLKSLDEQDLKKEFIHPEHGTRISLAENIGFYAWHSNHHLAHIKQALAHKGEF